MTRLLPLVLLALGACAYDARGPGGRSDDDDETPVADAGDPADAGESSDAGDPTDAGERPDAGDPTDAGERPDAGDLPDAGEACVDGGRIVTAQFTQEAAAALDVLLVVDDSGSMSEEQDALERAMPAFVAELDRLGVDFHLGVVTTDMEVSNSRAGVLRETAESGGRIVRPGVGAATALQSIVASVGVSGSGLEKGLAAMRAALTAPLATDPQKNGGFRRAGHALAVVVLSDEDDSSGGSVATFTDVLDVQLGVSPSATELDVLVGDAPGGCDANGLRAAVGTFYLVAQEATGGLAGSICASSYDDFFRDVARRASGAGRTFTLGESPVGAPDSVRVDGAEVPGGAWSLLNVRDIVFAVPPAAGAKIEVAYRAACR